MKSPSNSQSPHRGLTPLPPTDLALHEVRASRTISHKSQITQHDSQLPRHKSPVTYNYARLSTFLIDAAAIRNVRNLQKTNNGGHF
jgi:hypothetical protein